MSTAHLYDALINLIVIQGKSEYIVFFCSCFSETDTKAVKATNAL